MDTFLSARVDANNAVAECLEDNNVTLAAYFDLRATDPEGLYDAQRFTVTVENVNQAPSLLTTEVPPLASTKATAIDRWRRIRMWEMALSSISWTPPAGLVVEAISGELR